MKVQHEGLLKSSLNEGINLFLGAGFSLLAKDMQGKILPTGAELCQEIVKEFSCPDTNDLVKACTIINASKKDRLKEYLINRFKIGTFSPLYLNLLKISVKKIFTTNIDDLPYKIYEKSKAKFLNNVLLNGACADLQHCIEFVPLHGCVEDPEPKFTFTINELSTSYKSQRNAWEHLRTSLTQFPSIFIGYGMNDLGTLQALLGSSDERNNQFPKWIMLYEDNEGDKAYFDALGFKVVVGDTESFLKFIQNFGSHIPPSSNGDFLFSIFPNAKVPNSLSNTNIRKIEDFFMGDAPLWSDVFSSRIHPTKHLDEILNLVQRSKNLIITGIPASGKSTLLLQAGQKLAKRYKVAVFTSITKNQARLIRNEITSKTIILIDNFAVDAEAFQIICANTDIKVVGFDRYYNVDIISHMLPADKFDFYDVSELHESDIQSIHEKIPLKIRKPLSMSHNREKLSIFEFVNYYINKPKLNERFRPLLVELGHTQPLLRDILVMICYVHSCRTSVSFDLVRYFLSEDLNNFQEVYDIIDSLKGLIVDEAFAGEMLGDFEDQDYFKPRSNILAETIIEQTPSRDFQEVFYKFHDLVPTQVIPNYYIFKKRAYDADYTSKAFPYWEDGLDFYEMVYKYDRNPFVLQQCAIYLAKKKKYSEAAIKIDKARQISHKRFFSIENTHAIILFQANINAIESDEKTQIILDQSMAMLSECYNQDNRKTYHAVKYAQQAIEYYSRFPGERAANYLQNASEWIDNIRVEYRWRGEVRRLKHQIQKLL